MRYLVLVVAALALLTGCGGGDDEASGDTPNPPASATTTIDPADLPPTEAQPQPAPEVEDVDTGRMSQGEWEEARAAIFDVNGELQDYRTKLGEECVLILQAGQVAEGLDCIDESFDGVEGSIGLTVDRLGDLRGDVGGRCLKALTAARNVANTDLFQSAQATKRAADSLDIDAIQAVFPNFNRQQERWGKASGDTLQLCAPE